MTVTHFQRHWTNRGPAYAAVRFDIVFYAVVQAVRRDIPFAKHVDAVGQGHVHPAADRKRDAVIAFFRPEVDSFRASVEHNRTYFQIVTRANAAGLATIIGILQPVAFGVQARRGFTHFHIQIGEVFTLFNGKSHRHGGTRDRGQGSNNQDVKLFHGLLLVIKFV